MAQKKKQLTSFFFCCGTDAWVSILFVWLTNEKVEHARINKHNRSAKLSVSFLSVIFISILLWIFDRVVFLFYFYCITTQYAKLILRSKFSFRLNCLFCVDSWWLSFFMQNAHLLSLMVQMWCSHQCGEQCTVGYYIHATNEDKRAELDDTDWLTCVTIIHNNNNAQNWTKSIFK